MQELDPPYNPRVEQNGVYEATILWYRPNTNPAGYIITANPGNIIKNVIGNDFYMATIENLLPNTPYTFTIYAYYANNERSISVTAALDGVGTYGPTITLGIPGPTNLVATPSGNTDVLLTWTREITPTQNLPQGATPENMKITRYQILIIKNGTDGYGSEMIDNLQTLSEWPTSYVYKSSPAEESVKFAIRAYSLNYYSNFNTTITPNSIQVKVPGPEYVIGTWDKQVIWEFPTRISNSAVREWLITATNVSTSEIITKTTDENNLRLTISELVLGQTYIFTVGARYYNDNLQALYLTDTTTSSPILIATTSVPTAPRDPYASPELGYAQVNWREPIDRGSSTSIIYTVTSIPAVIFQNGNTTNQDWFRVYGLTNGVLYKFTVMATNAVGNSPISNESAEIYVSTVPDPPTNVTVIFGNGQATISWTAPVVNGGSVITSYTATSSPTGRSANTSNGSTTTVIVYGLTNGILHNFTVKANNRTGSSANSNPSDYGIFYTVPNAPTSVTGTSQNKQATISWIAPVVTGGKPIISYTINSIPNIVIPDVSSTTTTVTGLTNGTSYKFTVIANNEIGASVKSSQSSNIIPIGVPDAPTNITGIPGNKRATISWNAPVVNGGSAITSYTIKSIPNIVIPNVSATTITLTGLTNGTSYKFTVIANNQIGPSIESLQSGDITLQTKFIPDPPSGITCLINNKRLDLSWNIPYNGDTDISNYTVQYSSNNGTNWTNISSVVNNISVTGLTNGTSYIFRISTTNIIGTSAYTSNTPAFIPLNIVEEPIITNGEIGNQCVSIFFTQVNTTVNSITKYRYTLNNGTSFTELQTTKSPLFIKNLTNGTLYNIKISAYTSTSWSNMSNSLSVTPVDNRSNEIKTAITNLSINNISALKNQLFTDISSLSLNNKIQKINSLATDISSKSTNLQVSTLLNIALNIGSSSNPIKSNLNSLLVDAGLIINTPFSISDKATVSAILNDVTFKNSTWDPQTLDIIAPNNNLLTLDLTKSDLLLLLLPDIEYIVDAKYSTNFSTNKYRVVYNRTDTSRTLTINGSSNKKTIGDTLLFSFPNKAQLNFKINMLGSPGGEIILLPAGTGDPHILTVNGHEYMLPHDEKCYLLYDNNIENDRVIVTAKCWFLPEHIKDNSKFKNVLMTDTTFFKFINFYHNGENLTFDMETLNPVKYTNMKDLTKNHLKFIKNDTMIKISELIEDKFIFKCHYSKLKLKKYNINFDGQSK